MIWKPCCCKWLVSEVDCKCGKVLTPQEVIDQTKRDRLIKKNEERVASFFY